jgi:hypothetical protein
MVDNDRLTPPVSFEIKYIHFHQGQQSPILSITDRNNEDNFACAYPTKDKDSSFLYYLEKCLCEVIEHR